MTRTHTGSMVAGGSKIDLDYSPVQLEDDFADEDERALAAV
ncbi:hypothetical protein [Mycobacterium sp. TY815]|nr:hypothetical protein [Mycobacterium sp. TY815]MDP7704397.1 hypothetical protein [Mycobacterium sp. TY815]